MRSAAPGEKTMKELIWDEKYAIGIEEIDRQHMEFMRLLRRFNLGIQKAAPVSVQLRILEELAKYAEYHFCSEENIMTFTKYPEVSAQQAEHARLRNRLDAKASAYKRSPETGTQLSDFLYDWFVHHTQVEDRKIAAFLHGKMQLSKAAD
jgi:hemerythrin-like metal-binding protein